MDSARHEVHDRRWRLVILGSSILIYVVSSVYGLLHGFEDPLQSWNGYYTLVMDDTADPEEVDTRLIQEGIRDHVSVNTVLVDVSSFTSVDWQPYSRIRERITPEDPRYDAWIRDVGSWFETEHARIVYIPAHESIAPLMLRVNAALGPLGISWQLAEWRPIERLILLSAAMVTGILFVIASSKRRLITILSVLAWTPLSVSAGPVFFPFLVALLLLWSLLLESFIPALKRYAHDVPQAPFFWDTPTDSEAIRESVARFLPFVDQGAIKIRGILYCSFILLCSVVMTLAGSASLLPGIVLVHFFALPGLLILLGRLYQVRHRRSEHRLFAPVPLITRGRAFRTRLVSITYVLAILVSAVVLIFFLMPSRSSGAMPYGPGKDYGAVSFASLIAAQEDEKRVTAVPDLSDYIKHRAFQESFPYNRDYDWTSFHMPAEGAEWGVQRFESLPGGIRSWLDVRVVFDGAWLSGVLAQAPVGSIERMLADQGRVNSLVSTPTGAVYSADAWSLLALAGLAGLLIPLWILGREPGIRQFYGARRLPAGNRKLAA